MSKVPYDGWVLVGYFLVVVHFVFVVVLSLLFFQGCGGGSLVFSIGGWRRCDCCEGALCVDVVCRVVTLSSVEEASFPPYLEPPASYRGTVLCVDLQGSFSSSGGGAGPEGPLLAAARMRCWEGALGVFHNRWGVAVFR